MLAWLDAVEAEVETRFGNTRKALQLIHNGEDIFATGEPERMTHRVYMVDKSAETSLTRPAEIMTLSISALSVR